MKNIIKYGMIFIMMVVLMFTTVSCNTVESETENQLGDAVQSTV